MKFKMAIAASVLIGGSLLAPAEAAPVPGTYSATFTYPQHGTLTGCFTLTQTNEYPGYTSSGNWVDRFSGASGTYVVYKRTIHLAGPYGDSNVIAIDGQFSGDHLINTTFEIIQPGTGQFYAAGTFVESRDPFCGVPPAN